jgi:hypothetical protein
MMGPSLNVIDQMVLPVEQRSLRRKGVYRGGEGPRVRHTNVSQKQIQTPNKLRELRDDTSTHVNED